MPQRPNVLFVMADQMSRGFLPIHGHKLVKTPNIERLTGRDGTILQCLRGVRGREGEAARQRDDVLRHVLGLRSQPHRSLGASERKMRPPSKGRVHKAKARA